MDRFFSVCSTIIVLSVLSSSYAYQTGTGSCVGGIPAVTGSQHLNPLLHPIIRSGLLSDAGIVVVVEETKNSTTTTIALESNTSAILEINKEYVIAVVGTEYQYKGCFIRLEAISNQSSEDVANSLLPNYNTHSADYICSGSGYDGSVVGITHLNGSIFKSRHDGILRMDEPGKVQLDITIVGMSAYNDMSLYAYSNYSIEFVKPTKTTNNSTSNDTKNDNRTVETDTNKTGSNITFSSAPSGAPTKIKSGKPSGAPTKINSGKPSMAPTTAPSKEIIKTGTPSIVPTTAPSKEIIKTGTPSIVPTTPPSKEIIKTGTPSIVPTTAPSKEIIKTGTPSIVPTTPPSNVIIETGTPSMIPSLAVVKNDKDTSSQPTQQDVNPDRSIDDIKYTTLITETINDIQVTYNNVTLLTPSDLIKLETLHTQWFHDFYNNRSSQQQENDPTTTASKLITGNRRHRSVLEAPITSMPLPPQVFVVKGSMNTVITINDRQTILSDLLSKRQNFVRITYNQEISYRLHTNDSPSIPSSMKGSYYKPASTVDYIILPFRSVSGNNEFASLLKQQFPDSFQNLTTPIDAPLVAGDGNNSTPSSMSVESNSASNDDKMGIPVIIAIVLGGIAIILIIIYLLIKRPLAKCQDKEKGELTDDEDEKQTQEDANEEQNQLRNRAITSYDPSSYDAASQFTSGLHPSIVDEQPQDGETEEAKLDAMAMGTKSRKKIEPSVSSLTGASALDNHNKGSKSISPIEEYVIYAPAGKLGIVIDNPDDDSGPIIYAIRETSQLLDSKLRTGDRLVRVDEVDVTKMKPPEISQIISKRSRNPIRKLTLHRVVPT